MVVLRGFLMEPSALVNQPLVLKWPHLQIIVSPTLLSFILLLMPLLLLATRFFTAEEIALARELIARKLGRPKRAVSEGH